MSPEGLPKKGEIEVKMFGWKTAESGSILSTEGLGPCIGLLIYDPIRKKAGLGHWPAASSFAQSIRNKVNGFVSQADREVLKVYLRGGRINMGDEFDEGKKTDRKTVLDILRETGIDDSQIDTEWLGDSLQNAGMKINVDSGEFTYTLNDFTHDYLDK